MKGWTLVRVRTETIAELEKYRDSIAKQHLSGRLVIEDYHDRFGVSLDRAIRQLLGEKADHRKRSKRKKSA